MKERKKKTKNATMMLNLNAYLQCSQNWTGHRTGKDIGSRVNGSTEVKPVLIKYIFLIF